jgi:hypothetical protein
VSGELGWVAMSQEAGVPAAPRGTRVSPAWARLDRALSCFHLLHAVELGQLSLCSADGKLRFVEVRKSTQPGTDHILQLPLHHLLSVPQQRWKPEAGDRG